jgi:hypothetical protein
MNGGQQPSPVGTLSKAELLEFGAAYRLSGGMTLKIVLLCVGHLSQYMTLQV